MNQYILFVLMYGNIGQFEHYKNKSIIKITKMHINNFWIQYFESNWTKREPELIFTAFQLFQNIYICNLILVVERIVYSMFSGILSYIFNCRFSSGFCYDAHFLLVWCVATPTMLASTSFIFLSCSSFRDWLLLNFLCLFSFSLSDSIICFENSSYCSFLFRVNFTRAWYNYVRFLT